MDALHYRYQDNYDNNYYICQSIRNDAGVDN